VLDFVRQNASKCIIIKMLFVSKELRKNYRHYESIRLHAVNSARANMFFNAKTGVERLPRTGHALMFHVRCATPLPRFVSVMWG